MTFTDVKQQVLERCAAQNACESETIRLQNATTSLELLTILGENFRWCVGNHFTKDDFLTWFSSEELISVVITTTVIDTIKPLTYKPWYGNMLSAMDLI